eukprot:g19444.t1
MRFSTLCFATAAGGLSLESGLAQQATTSATSATTASAAVAGTFFFSVDLLEGETGYYNIEGYEGVQPEITMVRGQTYVFNQLDSSNWFHPLGFAYEPDGAHEGVDELEEEVGNGDAPVYKINGELSDLDTYEPQFFFPEEAWMESEYTVELTVTDPDVTEIFYFCHIHNLMSGRINIVDAEGDDPAETSIELYEPFTFDEFDTECGTFGSSKYAPADGTFESELCPNQKFLCGDVTDTFDRCMHAIDCKMNYEMRIERESAHSNTVAFMHQMIPHHENAVNMARVLLKNPGDEDLDEEVAAMLREVINSQNAQITFMRGFLAEAGAALVADVCENDSDDGDDDVPGWAIGVMALLGVACLSLLTAVVLKAKGPKDAAQGGEK